MKKIKNKKFEIAKFEIAKLRSLNKINGGYKTTDDQTITDLIKKMSSDIC